MSSIELTPSQRTILTALVNLYRAEEDAVKGESIAEEVDRNPGTIRNQMQSLKALQLVEGVPGPKGGYKPTVDAYEALDIQQLDTAAEVPVTHDGEDATEVNVKEINLTSVHHPELCRAEVHLRGSVRDFYEGDSVVVGPTPLSKLQVTGTVDGKADSKGVLILKIASMEAPAGEPAHLIVIAGFVPPAVRFVSMTTRVVVLGAGYAGAGAVSKLEDELGSDAELVWVSETDYHLVLHEAHRIIRDPGVREKITIPVEDIKSRRTEFVHDSVVDVDTDE